MIAGQAGQETSGVADVVVLEVPDVAEKFNGEGDVVALFPVQFPDDFEDLLGVVLAEVGVQQLGHEQLQRRPLRFRLLQSSIS